MNYGFSDPKFALFPPMVVVSIVNTCNLKCIHCHYTAYSQRPEYRANQMPWEIWQRLCDEIGEHPGTVLNLGTDGEPLLHKRLVEMLRYARSRGIAPINITTNAVLLKGKLAEAFAREHLADVVNVSLDAFSAETYRQIRGGDRDKTYAHLLAFLELRETHATPTKVQVNIIDQPEVHHELEAFKAYWQPKVDSVLVRTYYDATHVTGAPGPNITGKQVPFAKEERWPCQQFWRRINVADDGTVHFCVDDWYKKTEIGRLPDSTLAEIWQSGPYQRLRELQLAGEYDKIPYCAECTEWQGMRWDYDYFLLMEKMLGTKLI